MSENLRCCVIQKSPRGPVNTFKVYAAIYKNTTSRSLFPTSSEYLKFHQMFIIGFSEKVALQQTSQNLLFGLHFITISFCLFCKIRQDKKRQYFSVERNQHFFEEGQDNLALYSICHGSGTFAFPFFYLSKKLETYVGSPLLSYFKNLLCLHYLPVKLFSGNLW